MIFLFRVQYRSILVPRARRFLVTWSGNEGLWKQPLPDVRKFLTSGRACAEVTNITAHAHNGFLSLTAPLGEKFYFLSSLQRVASLDVLKMYHFTQLGFTDNLENLKKTVTETGRTHRWFAELRQLIGRLSSELCESNIAKIDIMRVKVNLKKYLVSCPATAILLQAIFGHK